MNNMNDTNTSDIPNDLNVKISEILLTAINGQEPKYRFEDKYIRWGLVEKDIHATINEHTRKLENRLSEAMKALIKIRDMSSITGMTFESQSFAVTDIARDTIISINNKTINNE